MPKAVPGWQKLLDDCDAVEALFKRKTFKGEFQMTLWGRHSGERDHALNPVDTLVTWTEMAEDVYGLDNEQAHELFCEGSNPSLAAKLKEARDLAAYLKEEAEQS